jgi:hypothetical protein
VGVYMRYCVAGVDGVVVKHRNSIVHC